MINGWLTKEKRLPHYHTLSPTQLHSSSLLMNKLLEGPLWCMKPSLCRLSAKRTNFTWRKMLIDRRKICHLLTGVRSIISFACVLVIISNCCFRHPIYRQMNSLSCLVCLCQRRARVQNVSFLLTQCNVTVFFEFESTRNQNRGRKAENDSSSSSETIEDLADHQIRMCTDNSQTSIDKREINDDYY